MVVGEPKKMQVSIEAGEGLERKMTVVIPSDDSEKEIAKRLNKIAKTIKMDGFRPGKVPLRLVKQRFSGHVRQEVLNETIESSLSSAFQQIAVQDKIQIAGDPKNIEFNKADDAVISYTVVFDTMPEVILDLTDISVERPKATLVDSDIDDMIEKLRQQKMTWEAVDREAKEGDRLTINFKGTIDGEDFDGGSAEGITLELGSNQMVEGFESGLIGVKKGEERQLNIQFPDDYSVKKLAGQKAVFDVLTTAVEAPVLPEIDRDFIQSFGVKSENKADLEAEIRKNMAFELKQKLKSTTKQNVMDALFKKHNTEIPKGAIEKEATVLRDQTKENMKQQGQETNFEMPTSIFEEQAKKRIVLGLLISNIVKDADLKIEESKVDELIKEHAESYEDPTTLIEYYNSNPEARRSIENIVMEEQVVEYVLSKVQVNDKEMSFSELTQTES